MKVIEQTKHGWAKRQMTAEEVERFQRAKQLPGYSRDEFDTPATKNEMDLYQEVQNLIQIGPVGLELDKLSGPMKQILYAPSEWHISKSNKLYKVTDPITQVYEYGEWGNDIEEADPDKLDNWDSTGKLYLEQSGLINPEGETDFADILGPPELSEDVIGDITNTSYLQRVEDYEETPITNDNEEDSTFRSYQTPSITSLPEETLIQLDELTTDYKKLDNPSELEQLAYEQKVDQVLSRRLTFSINSPYCARGYTAPRRHLKGIYIPRPTVSQDAAEKRVELFYKLFGEAAACDNIRDLYGPYIKDAEGKTVRTGGFYGRIREMHSADKELALQWSMKDYKGKDGNIILSAFTQQRREFIRNWREEGKGDEESLRAAVWVWFDRTAGETAPKYDERTGKRIADRKVYKDSIWRQKRTKALAALNLTKPQWDGIYKILGFIKARLNPNRKFMACRKEVMTKLTKVLDKVHNIQDFNSYLRWAQKREFIYKSPITGYRRNKKNQPEPIYKGTKVNTYIPNPSLIDQITPDDEIRWRKLCRHKRRALERKLFTSRWRAQQIVKITSSNKGYLEEVFLPCAEPQCYSMVSGIPRTAHLNDGKKLDFIVCEECGKYVWLEEEEHE